MRKVPVLLILTIALASCGVFDNHQETPDPFVPPAAETGLLVDLRSFTPYAGKQVDLRLVGGDGTVLGLYRVEKLTLDAEGDYRLNILSVPAKPNSDVDVMVDSDGDGVYGDGEPGWSKPLNATRSVQFFGNAGQTAIPVPSEPGGDVTIFFNDFGALDGKLLRLAMINPANQITGLYTGTVHGDSFDVSLPGIAVNTEPYTFAIFADASGNGKYDAPPTDAAWYIYATGSADGISYVFPYNEDFEDVGF